MDRAWGTAELIKYDNSDYTYDPQIALDGSGNAIVVWFQDDGTYDSVYANRYVAGTGWGTATEIDDVNAGDAQFPQIASDGSGNVIAVWIQDDGTYNSVYANRYVAGTGWGTAELIEIDGAGAYRNHQIAFDGDGNAMTVWFQAGINHYNIWANRYVAGTGWGTAELIEDYIMGHAQDPKIALDDTGNAMAVWEQHDGSSNKIWANRFE
ncbi:MAG: hypothetical protein GY696_33620 [Gammaproteobacteria bacterium]|nr:hypothetical protein [Gammaproteobacteria bacterium]